MKKVFITLMLIVVVLSGFSFEAYAKNGDVIGEALNTDIVTYINHYAIPCFIVNDRACVVAEDLANYGFDVIWNECDRSVTISRNPFKNKIKFIPVTKLGACASKFCNILETDVEVFAAGKKIKSYAIEGYTLIPLEELAVFGSVKWNPDYRSLKLWIKDGLEMRTTPQKTINTVTEFTEFLNGVWVNMETYREGCYDFVEYRRNCMRFGAYPECYYEAEILSAKEIGRNKYLFSVYYPENEIFDIKGEYGTEEIEFVYGDNPYIPGWDGDRWYYMGIGYAKASKAAERFVRYSDRY